jgi:peptide/nickel transport system ATP-binding protein
MSALLEIERLEVGFGRTAAVRGASFSVAAGETHCLVGESGCGKSVTALSVMNLLARNARRNAERLAFQGEDLLKLSDKGMSRLRGNAMAMIFQEPMTSLNPAYTVGSQMTEVLRRHKGASQRVATDRAADLLARVGITAPGMRLGQFPHQLSGGLRQRVMIAMAVARRPTLVIADEPTTALDVVVQAEIASLFRRLRDDLRVAFLFITHDLALAAQISDRVVVMYGGRVAEAGPTRQILGQPRHPYSAALLQTRLTLDVDTATPLPTLPGEPPDPRRLAAECPFVPRCRFAAGECRDGLPDLSPVAGSGHQVACRRVDQINVMAATAAPGDDLAGPPSRPAGGRPPAASHVLASVVSQHGAAAGMRARRWPRRPRVSSGAVTSRGSAAGEPAAVLRVQNLAKAFGGHQAVRGVSFSIAAGRAMALVGESGCGKTTTLRMVVGLERQDGGQAVVAPGPRPQMIFQDVGASLTPWMTVGQLLQERLRAESVPRVQWTERIDAVLALTGLLPDTRDRRPGRLSGGQRQRVALARAVIVTPPLLVCDEPTSALDVSLASTALNLLNSLRRELGMAVLIVTHDLAVARATSEHIAVMQDGEIVEHGEISQVLTSPATAYTRRLLAAVPAVTDPAKGGCDGVR